MSHSAIEPALDPDHDCEQEYSPLCVDACADPCECGCNEEPDSPTGVLVVDPDTGESRPATTREASQWAKVMVNDGVLPADHPQVLKIARLHRLHILGRGLRLVLWAAAGCALGGLFDWLQLSPSETGVGLLCLAGLYVCWLFARP